jgi:hypothetical protein
MNDDDEVVLLLPALVLNCYVKYLLRMTKLGTRYVQGGLIPNKISGVGTIFGLLVHVLPGPTRQRALNAGILLS